MSKHPLHVTTAGVLAAGLLFGAPASLIVANQAFAVESSLANSASTMSATDAAVPAAEAGEYFYRQLSESEKRVYTQLKSQAGTAFNDSQTPAVAIRVPEGERSPGDRMIYAFFRDYPEYFWIAPEKLAWTRDKSEIPGEEILKLTLKGENKSYFIDGFTNANLQDKRREFNERVEKIIAGAPSDPQQMLLYFTNWLALNNTYNKYHMSAPNSSRVASASLLSDNNDAIGPVCYGYATGMKVLLNRVGIENAYIEGWAFNDKNQPSGEQHAWNNVKVDGKWYAIDPTWEDSGVLGVGARKQYFLVGAETVTQPGFKTELQKFAGNHQATIDKSPALRSHGFSLPQLNPDGLTQSAHGIELIKADGTSQSIENFEDALAQAKPGDTIRLWRAIELDKTINLPDGIKLDLNGQGTNSVPAIRSKAGIALHIPAGHSVAIINTGARQSTIASTAAAAAVQNDGKLMIHPRVVLRAGSIIPAVGGSSAAQPAAQTYLAAPGNGRTMTGYQVAQPLFVGQDDSEVIMHADYDAQEGDTIAALEPVVKAAPEVQWKFLLPQTNSLIDIPAEYRPKLEWKLISTPAGEVGTSDVVSTSAGARAFNMDDAGATGAADTADPTVQPLQNGRYLYTAEGFGYSLLYAVDVTNAAEPEAELEETPTEEPEVNPGEMPVTNPEVPGEGGDENTEVTPEEPDTGGGGTGDGGAGTEETLEGSGGDTELVPDEKPESGSGEETSGETGGGDGEGVEENPVITPDSGEDNNEGTEEKPPAVVAPVAPALDPVKAGEEAIKFSEPTDATKATLVIGDTTYNLKRAENGAWQLISDESAGAQPVDLVVEEGKIVVPVAALKVGQNITLTLQNAGGKTNVEVTVAPVEPDSGDGDGDASASGGDGGATTPDGDSEDGGMDPDTHPVGGETIEPDEDTGAADPETPMITPEFLSTENVRPDAGEINKTASTLKNGNHSHQILPKTGDDSTAPAAAALGLGALLAAAALRLKQNLSKHENL